MRAATSPSRPRIASASSSMPRLASISSATMSASCAPLQAIVTMARSSRRRGAKMPGVSMKTSCDAALDGDAAHQRARGLHLRADDRHLAADQRVDQRRLADIGRADQGDEAAAGGRAGLVRARCRLSHRLPPPRRPRASAGLRPPPARRRAWSGRPPRPAAASGSTTETRNSGSWCGPVRSTSR